MCCSSTLNLLGLSYPSHLNRHHFLPSKFPVVLDVLVPVKPPTPTIVSGGIRDYSFDINMPAHHNPNGPIRYFYFSSPILAHLHIEGSVTQKRNSIFCQNEYLISKCSKKCGFSRKHRDLTPPNTPLKLMASET